MVVLEENEALARSGPRLGANTLPEAGKAAMKTKDSTPFYLSVKLKTLYAPRYASKFWALPMVTTWFVP